MIQYLYGNGIDGIISPSLWPSYHQGGFQHPEVCIFQPVGKVEVSPFTSKGGGKKKNSKFSCDTFREELREMGIDPEKALKWNPNLLL
jgi:hypothetical protein